MTEPKYGDYCRHCLCNPCRCIHNNELLKGDIDELMKNFIQKTTMKTGIELIAAERQEQIEKHGRTVIKDVKTNPDHDLTHGAIMLLANDFDWCPNHWEVPLCQKMINKPYKDRLIIASALIAAEIDRINYNETK